MFGRKRELIAATLEVKKRIDPGIKVRTAAQTVSDSPHGAETLAGMMNQNDGQAGFALQGPQVAEQGGHLAGDVFVQAVQSH